MADKKPQTTERFTSQALDDAERGSAIVKVVTKRIRAASKRLKKIEATEAKAQGQPDRINQDQVHAAFTVALRRVAAVCMHRCSDQAPSSSSFAHSSVTRFVTDLISDTAICIITERAAGQQAQDPCEH